MSTCKMLEDEAASMLPAHWDSRRECNFVGEHAVTSICQITLQSYHGMNHASEPAPETAS